MFRRSKFIPSIFISGRILGGGEGSFWGIRNQQTAQLVDPRFGNITYTSTNTWAEFLTIAPILESRGSRVILHFTGPRTGYVDGGTGAFSLPLWKTKMDDFVVTMPGGVPDALNPYIAKGLVVGHNGVDEPQDTAGNWNGHEFVYSDINDMSAYTKTKWPTLNTYVATEASWLAGSMGSYPSLDAILPQFGVKAGADLVVASWVAAQDRDSQRLGVGLMLSINVAHGGIADVPLTAAEFHELH